MTDKIELAFWQNDMTFRFVGLHFDDPLRNEYKVLLDNYDREWRDIGNERFATYTNLSSGSYTFRVKAANKDGVWNEEGISLKIKNLATMVGIMVGIYSLRLIIYRHHLCDISLPVE